MVVMTFAEVEPSYQGARLEDDNITLDFVQKMMDDFKQQRSIHSRYFGAFYFILLHRMFSMPSMKCFENPIL